MRDFPVFTFYIFKVYSKTTSSNISVYLKMRNEKQLHMFLFYYFCAISHFSLCTVNSINDWFLGRGGQCAVKQLLLGLSTVGAIWV